MMLSLGPAGPMTVLCLGAHADDIEIGCGGTLLSLIRDRPGLKIWWCVLSANGEREAEARQAASRFLEGTRHSIELCRFRDSYFPAEHGPIKEWFEQLATRVKPDLILTHYREDLHQDHRVVGELTWNTFRNHVILEYEVPKYDGDMGRPNVFQPLSSAVAARKLELLGCCFASQQRKDWYDEETFRGLMRLRGVECRAPERYAEAFYGRKLVLNGRP